MPAIGPELRPWLRKLRRCEPDVHSPSLKNPPRFRLACRSGPRLTFESELGFTAHLFVLEADIIRVALLSGSRFSMTRTWSVAPGQDDVADGGRDRFDTSGFSTPPF